MLIDGKAIAADILRDLKTQVALLERRPVLTAVTCAPAFETQKYLAMKKAKAAAIGVSLNVIELSDTATTDDCIACVQRLAEESDGVVVQLPFPDGIDVAAVIAAVPVDKDPDGFHYGEQPGAALPPVAGAIAEISERHQIEWKDKKVVVLGEGRLVGKPVAQYARTQGAMVTVLNKQTFDPEIVVIADIIVSGVGQPGLITEDMVKPGVIIFDAGTSEDGGVLVGDVVPEVANKAALLTPVPGGIGPITIACLLKSLIGLVR